MRCWPKKRKRKSLLIANGVPNTIGSFCTIDVDRFRVEAAFPLREKASVIAAAAAIA